MYVDMYICVCVYIHMTLLCVRKAYLKGLYILCSHCLFGHSQKDKTRDGKQTSSSQGLWVGGEGHCKGIVQGISWDDGTILCSDYSGHT